MKKNLIVQTFILFQLTVLMINPSISIAKTTDEHLPNSICNKLYEKEWEEFNSTILQDIVNSFEVDLSGYVEIKRDDLNLKVGDHMIEHYDKITLHHLFVGASLGEMRLFLKDGLSGEIGYFLYKRHDGNNVIKKLSKVGDVWVVMNVDEVKAKKIKFKKVDFEKCGKKS